MKEYERAELEIINLDTDIIVMSMADTTWYDPYAWQPTY